jgi:hypothetical protein
VLEIELSEPEPAAGLVAACASGVSAAQQNAKGCIVSRTTDLEPLRRQQMCYSYAGVNHMRTRGRKLTKGFRNHHIGCFRIYIGCGHGVRGSGAARALQQGLGIQPQQRVGAGVRVGREPPRLVLRHNKPQLSSQIWTSRQFVFVLYDIGNPGITSGRSSLQVQMFVTFSPSLTTASTDTLPSGLRHSRDALLGALLCDDCCWTCCCTCWCNARETQPLFTCTTDLQSQCALEYSNLHSK